MTTPAPARKIRCRLVDRHGSRCTSEALGDLACLRHTREIADEWTRLVADAVDQYPKLRSLLDDSLEDDQP